MSFLSGLGSILGPVGTIAGALGSIGGLFGKTTEQGGGQTVNTTTPSQQMLYDWLAKYLPQYTPGTSYTGQLTAGKTPQESQSLSMLNQYMGSPNLGELGTAGKGQLLDTLSGKYANPATSPYIQSMQTMANRNLEDAISKSRLGQGSRGKFYSTAGLQEEGRLTGASQDYLNTLIGQFIENERGRQYGAVPTAMQAEEYETKTMPLSKISAGQTYGALDRTLEQSNLEAQYQEWQRSRSELSQLPGLLGNTQTGINMTMPTTTQSNSLGNILKLLQQLPTILNQ